MIRTPRQKRFFNYFAENRSEDCIRRTGSRSDLEVLFAEFRRLTDQFNGFVRTKYFENRRNTRE